MLVGGEFPLKDQQGLGRRVANNDSLTSLEVGEVSTKTYQHVVWVGELPERKNSRKTPSIIHHKFWGRRADIRKYP